MSGRASPIFLVLLAAACVGSRSEPASRMIHVGARSLHAVVAGTGSPAVVFDGGIASGCDAYRKLQDRIAVTTTSITYDRAGYGSSEPGPLPRDSRSEVEELRSLLRGLNVPGPYILVGHSLGGLNVQVYAGSHPEEVAGMVLLDPPPLPFILGEKYTELRSMAERMTEEWKGIADRGSQSENEKEKAKAGFYRMLASEHREMFAASAKQASSIASFGDIPLVVIASGAPNPAFGDVAGSYQTFWAAESEKLAAKSTRGRFVFAKASTHQLQRDAEDLVAGEILSMVSLLRSPGR